MHTTSTVTTQASPLDKGIETVVKRVDTFKGDGFLNWKFKLEMALRTSISASGDFLDWIHQNRDDVITLEMIQLANHELMMNNMYYILAQRTEKESLDILRNTAEQNGAEAWRLICARFDNRIHGKRIHLIRRVINPGKVKQLVDLPSAIDKWESSVRRLSSDFNIKILDDPNCDVIKIGILAEMLPVGVSEVMTQKLCDDVKSYKEAKDVIARFMAFKDDTGPAPMDCSHVNGYSWDAWTQPEKAADDENIE